MYRAVLHSSLAADCPPCGWMYPDSIDECYADSCAALIEWARERAGRGLITYWEDTACHDPEAAVFDPDWEELDKDDVEYNAARE